MERDSFSRVGRASDLASMSADALDLLVIGGGITGAGIARDAALRGLRIGLVERADFASGTSSRSSKLIHGGVRYLQQGDIPLVLEAAEERRILRRIAPHLTQPRPMMFPTYGRGTHTKLNVGLWTYEKLAKIPDGERHEMLDRDGALEREPGLCADGLTGAAVYPENLTDDARLVVATLRAARRAGAMIANYSEVRAIEASATELVARVHDREEDRTFAVHARQVVNAAGPWCDAVRALEAPIEGAQLHLTKGIHFTVAREDLPIRAMIVMQAADRRPVFAIPRGDVVYVGTTDTDYGRVADYPEVTRADVEYLIEAVHRTFPAARWGVERVCGAWAGLRPLLHEEGKKPSEISRKDEVTTGPAGMISVAGGKLTTFRAMAEKVVDLVEERLGRPPSRRGIGREQPLDGGELPEGATVEALADDLRVRFGASLPGVEAIADRLVFHHGSHAAALAARAVEERSGFLSAGGVLRAEVDQAVDGEMALRLTDVLERRLRLLLFDRGRGLDVAEEVAGILASRLGWSDERRVREVEDYRRTAAACLPV